MDSCKYVLLVEYDGTRYHGFQWQLGVPTIQDEMEQAMRKFCGGSSRIMAASRTDAGVHARGQVVSFWARPDISTATMVRALNYYLPADIAVKAAGRAGDDFSVRRDALSRTYHYYILNSDIRTPFGQRFTLLTPAALDVEGMNEACQFIKGEHDFASFTSAPEKGGTVRRVYEAKVRREGKLVVFCMIANAFLRHQVRNTVGLLLHLGQGKKNCEDVRNVLTAKKYNLAGPRAPSRGLFLTRVNYPADLCGQELAASVLNNRDLQFQNDQGCSYEEFR